MTLTIIIPAIAKVKAISIFKPIKIRKPVPFPGATQSAEYSVIWKTISFINSIIQIQANRYNPQAIVP